jgi:hypothetical protein
VFHKPSLVCIPSALKSLSRFPLVQRSCVVAIDGEGDAQYTELIAANKPKQITPIFVFPENSLLLLHNRFHYNGIEFPLLPPHGAEVGHIGTDIKCFPLVGETLV